MDKNIQKIISSDFNIKKFQFDLISWFNKEKRDLPWRHDKTPYKVWVSEIMLQQTKVDTVIPYFHRFMEKFPTVESLAEAKEEDVLKAWEGLGYYSRARNLQAAVREVATVYNGQVPDQHQEILKLKGVGSYTAGAILSFAYNKPEPAVDGNVMRVLSRIFAIEDDISKISVKNKFEDIVRSIISNEHPSDFNEGLIELGAIICTPKSPACMLCPVVLHCRAFEQGCQSKLPVKKKKKAPTKKDLISLVILDKEGNVLIHKRTQEALLNNLWEFPTFEVNEKLSSQTQIETFFIFQQLFIDNFNIQFKTNLKHVFSHLIWSIKVYVINVDQLNVINEHTVINLNDIEKYPFPVVFQKLIKILKEEKN